MKEQVHLKFWYLQWEKRLVVPLKQTIQSWFDPHDPQHQGSSGEHSEQETICLVGA